LAGVKPAPPALPVAVLAATLAVLLLAGCTSGDQVRGPAAASRASGAPSGAPASSRAVAPGNPAAIIESIRVRRADAGADLDVGPLSGQVAVAEPTLDLCYALFDSEAHRVARRLYAISQTEGTQAGRNDVVIYDDAAAAGQAMAQARRAVSDCLPGVQRPSTTADHPDAAFGYAALPAPALTGLAPGALAVSETAVYRDGSVQRRTRILQQRGRILVVIDGYAGQAVALTLARLCARRLAAVPADQAGG
jgi:hypothetical protein